MTYDYDLGPNSRLIGKPGSRHDLATPALLLDLDALEHNLATMAAHCREQNLALRPHGKTHKSVRIAQMQQQAGAIGLCVATVREAATMVDAGISSVHLTSPIMGEVKCDALVSLINSSRNLSAVIDNVDQAKGLEQSLRRQGKSLPILVDIDMGAMYRTGVGNPDDAIALARYAEQSDVLEYAGVQFYSGIVQHIKTSDERSQFYGEQLQHLASLLDRLRSDGLPPKVVSGGGTGTIEIDARSGLFTENQAGSYLFLDVEYAAIELFSARARPLQTALFVQTTVISNNAPGIVTTDAGYKSLAADGPMPRIKSGAPEGASYQFFGDEFGMILFGADSGMPESSSQMQEMMHEGSQPHEMFYNIFSQMKGKTGELPVGTKVELVTPHCDPTVNLHRYYHCVRGDILVDIWPIDVHGSI